MRANEWTDWELVRFLAKAFEEGECGIGYDLEFVRGDKVLEMDQDKFGAYVSPADTIREMKVDPKNVMYLIDDSDSDFFRLDTFEDVRSALEEIEDKSKPYDDEDDEDDDMAPFINEWNLDRETIRPVFFSSERELVEFLMNAEYTDPYDRYWYGEIENFNGETYTAEEVMEDICPEWFEDDQKVKLYIFCGDTKKIEKEED